MDRLDSISDSISRASGIHCRAKETYALYFSKGRIASVAQTSPHFITRTGVTGKNVVGVYKTNVDFRMVIEDIEAFYKEAEKEKKQQKEVKLKTFTNLDLSHA